tara:strand:- start:2656 stop:3480 length:825 start_codon:yes stop_codon:yes gene_type:complete
MKHIKLYEQFLNEMKIGKTLFSKTTKSTRNQAGFYYKDKTGGEQYGWDQNKFLGVGGNETFTQRLKDSMKNYVDELNTPEEQRFIKFLYNWVEEGKDQKTFPPSLYKDLKSLMKMKKKFPLILDPLAAVSIGKNVWRGATLPIGKAKEIIDNGKLSYDKYGLFEGEPPSYYKIKTKVSSRAFETKKYTSFTSSFRVAARFYHYAVTDKKDSTTRIPCILETSSKNKNLLFNSNFLSLFSHFRESEIFYIGDGTMDITGIYFDTKAVEAKLKNKK